jgi:hypothetical protein
VGWQGGWGVFEKEKKEKPKKEKKKKKLCT